MGKTLTERDLIQELKIYLFENDIEQKALAKKLYVHESTMSRIINNIQKPSERLLYKINKLLKSTQGATHERN